MSYLRDNDVQWCVRRLPVRVRDLLQQRSDVFLAGGFIRACIAHETVNDVDLFVPNSEVASEVAKLLAADSHVHVTENALSLEIGALPVQVIHRWVFDTPQKCVDSFDFTIARAAIWYVGGGWQSCCHPDFYSDLAAKRLVYLSPVRNEDAGGSMLRVLKFYQRGYRIPLESLGAVVARMIGGMEPNLSEVQVATVVTGRLREVDPLAGRAAGD